MEGERREPHLGIAQLPFFHTLHDVEQTTAEAHAELASGAPLEANVVADVGLRRREAALGAKDRRRFEADVSPPLIPVQRGTDAHGKSLDAVVDSGGRDLEAIEVAPPAALETAPPLLFGTAVL